MQDVSDQGLNHPASMDTEGSAGKAQETQRSPTVILPTRRVPAMDVLTTGMCSDSSDSKTLHSTAGKPLSDLWTGTPWQIGILRFSEHGLPGLDK